MQELCTICLKQSFGRLFDCLSEAFRHGLRPVRINCVTAYRTGNRNDRPEPRLYWPTAVHSSRDPSPRIRVQSVERLPPIRHQTLNGHSGQSVIIN